MSLTDIIFTPELTDIVLDEYWNNSIIGLTLVSGDGSWITVNPTLCHLLEYTLVELREMSFQDVTHPDDLESDIAMSRRIIDGLDTGYVMKKRYITKTGQLIWVLLKVTPIMDEEGKFKMFLTQVYQIDINIINPMNKFMKDELDKKGILCRFVNFLKFWD